MKMFKKLLMVSALSLSLFGLNSQADAAITHSVQSGDTYWKIAQNYGVPVTQLKLENKRNSDLLFVGEVLSIPYSSISQSDKDLMARLVSAEAKGEPYAGKVAVATVILNRVDSSKFPNTIKEVIYQIDSGYYAFTPVQNGTINQTADALSKKAVEEAIAFRGQGNGSLYFYNPNTASSNWILSREVTVTIGNHKFAK